MIINVCNSYQYMMCVVSLREMSLSLYQDELRVQVGNKRYPLSIETAEFSLINPVETISIVIQVLYYPRRIRTY